MGNPLESWAAGISQEKRAGEASQFPHPVFTGGRGPAPAIGCPGNCGRGRTGALLGGCGRSSAGCERFCGPQGAPSNSRVPCHPPAYAVEQQPQDKGATPATSGPSLPAPASCHRDPRAGERPRQ